MAWKNKVVWSEGMLLQPQHLQQHDRYWQSQLENRVAALRPYSWGFADLKIDEHQLALGKLALQSCTAVLPDGTPFTLPADDELPLPLDIPADARNVLVVLALPLRRHGVAEVDNGIGPDNFARHRADDYEAWDSNGLDNSALMQVGKLRLRLALASEVANAYATIGVARIIERRADNRVVIDPDYSAPCLDFRAAPRLSAFADELAGLLHQRGDLLAARLSQPGAAGAAEIADFLLLQLINRVEPLVQHLAGATGVHPETLYQALVSLAGELATFTDAGKRSATYPVYRHEQLAETFAPVIADLRRALSTVMDSQAVPIPLDERQFGIRVAVVPDRELLRSATFVLAVNAHLPPEQLRGAFPAQVKIGSVEKIRDLVNLQLPGIGLRPLPVAPRQLPFYAGYTYFELDSGSEYFQQLQQSAGFAMHVAGDFPGLQMQFWAIRR
ncbi:type VI secretion system baseplate subunit TssK [Massilia sp. PAMC28688]|uniref:type VI secretion system baseplate subunit TssK n=1 Tax=Massilia sp. PAMC28688 TaxID=2861283 RepID=UPI001C6274A1|nr:type VI secretion system baseplate subunit TssK [Massilia sp. PAMC28688]QYF95737.1 type VI secretion system baseplate subunit TssK [Massilia sp. PAMC28688]